MPKHVIAPEINGTMIELSKALGTTADNPLEYLNDLLSTKPGMPEGCVI